MKLFMAAFAALLIASTSAQAKPKHHKATIAKTSISCGYDRGVSLCPGSEQAAGPKFQGYESLSGGSFLPHPSGCPPSAFCACGAAVELFGGSGKDWLSLWPARAWYKFPRSQSPGAGDVAVRNHHVFVLRQHIEGDVYLVANYNSGGHLSRLQERSIKGYTIVSPSRSHVAQLTN